MKVILIEADPEEHHAKAAGLTHHPIGAGQQRRVPSLRSWRPGPITYEVVVPEAVGVLSMRGEAPKPTQCPAYGCQTGFWVVFPEARGAAVEA